jgi:hypothetical protein
MTLIDILTWILRLFIPRSKTIQDLNYDLVDTFSSEPVLLFNRYYVPQMFWLKTWFVTRTAGAGESYRPCQGQIKIVKNDCGDIRLHKIGGDPPTDPSDSISVNDVFVVTINGRSNSAFKTCHTDGIVVTDIITRLSGVMKIRDVIPFILFHVADGIQFDLESLFLKLLFDDTFETKYLFPENVINFTKDKSK